MVARLTSRELLLIFLGGLGLLCAIPGGGRAQSSHLPDASGAVEQNETMLDTLKRMQIKREESEFKKLVEKSEKIRENADLLAEELKQSAGIGNSMITTLSPRHEKMIREIEKFARQIRAESGGSLDEELSSPPRELAAMASSLLAASDRLKSALSKTSRRVVSVAVIKASNEVIELAKLIRGRFRAP